MCGACERDLQAVWLCSVCDCARLSLEWGADLRMRVAGPMPGANLAEAHQGSQGLKRMAGKNGSRGDEEGKTGLITKTRPKTKKPSLYKVLLLNDDYTPMEFVVHVLERFFNKGREEATRIMLHVHQKGVGICGVYHLRGRRDQGRAGDGLFAPAPASSAVHHGKGVRDARARILAKPRNRPAPRARVRQRAPPRVRDARAPAALAARRSRRRGRDEGLLRRPRRAASAHHRIPRQRALRPVRQGRDGGAADHRLPARDPSRRGARAVLRPRGGDRRQRAGRHLRRAREPCRLLPAGAGDDALRRGAVHQPRHRQAARHVRARARARRRRGHRPPRSARRRSSRRTRSTPTASTSTRRPRAAASIR